MTAAYPLVDDRDPVDVAEEWVEVALQGRPWEARDSDGEPPCFIQRGTDRDGDCQHFIESPLSSLDACIIERLLEVARGEHSMSSAAYPLHHPDDSTLTVEYALRTLRDQNHQRIAALLEWLAEEYEAVIRQQEREVRANG